MIIHDEVQAWYENHLNKTVDYGQGPRSPIKKRLKRKFLNFEPEHNGQGFIGHIPYQRMFFISDHHFGHANIIKYANRPFDDVQTMNETMIERHNDVVGPDDYVLFGGDIGFAPGSVVNKHLKRMHGYKIFVLGNHDFERDDSVKDYDVDEWWLHWQPFRLEEEFELVFTHYPLDDLPKDVVNIHGHIHDKMSPNPQHINLCVEQLDYTPMRMDRVLEIARMRFIEMQG